MTYDVFGGTLNLAQSNPQTLVSIQLCLVLTLSVHEAHQIPFSG